MARGHSLQVLIDSEAEPVLTMVLAKALASVVLLSHPEHPAPLLCALSTIKAGSQWVSYRALASEMNVCI